MHASFSERKKTEGNQGATSPALKWQLSQEHPSGSVRVATSDANQPLLTEKKKRAMDVFHEDTRGLRVSSGLVILSDGSDSFKLSSHKKNTEAK